MSKRAWFALAEGDPMNERCPQMRLSCVDRRRRVARAQLQQVLSAFGCLRWRFQSRASSSNWWRATCAAGARSSKTTDRSVSGRPRLVAAARARDQRGSVFSRTLRALRRRVVRIPASGRAWAQAGLLSDVTTLWSPAWRERLSDEQNRASLEADLRHKLGNETFELLENLADSLHEQKLAGLALAYLRERLRER